MPKVLVIFLGDDASAAAESAAAGAKKVRFMEVDIRAAFATTTRHPVIDPAAEQAYDGLVIVDGAGSDDGFRKAFASVRGWTTENTVVAIFGSKEAPAGLDTLGAIVVVPPAKWTGNHGAEHLGARVAKVAGWVRHGLGHEADSPAPGRSHEHGHHHH